MIEMKRSRSYQLFVYIIDLNEKSFVVDTHTHTHTQIGTQQNHPKQTTNETNTHEKKNSMRTMNRIFTSGVLYSARCTLLKSTNLFTFQFPPALAMHSGHAQCTCKQNARCCVRRTILHRLSGASHENRIAFVWQVDFLF